MRRHPRTLEPESALLLRSRKRKQLSWEDTFRQMARENEDWSDLDETLADGLALGDKW